MPLKRILVVDDDYRTRELLSTFLESSPHAVTLASSGREAIGAMALGAFDVIVTDLSMPDGDGIDVIKAARRHSPRARIVAMTRQSIILATDYLNQAKALSVDAILIKPFLRDRLLGVLHDLEP